MSEVIDSRIVEMRFDNSQFESNVRESMKTIDSLKSSLNFEDSIKGLDKLKFDIDASGAIHSINAISDAASECDLSALNNSAESVKLTFSALEVIAVTALGKITSAAIEVGANLVKAFAVQPVSDGFAEYNQQLQSTRVIVSNTGQSLDEVTRVLNDLNEYADLTIYSFGDMTQAMGYFTAALGEKSAEASAIIAKGITNWAASTGQGAQVAKRVMYQVSQALSTDAFKLMDWKSIENTGAMAGKRYRDYFLETASEIYNKTVDDLLVDKQGRATSFRGSLETGWLSTEVFLKTMEKFASGVGDFKWMEDAATKVLTFSDLMDTVREQLGTGWGETWKIVFGTYEDSIKFYSGISDIIGKFVNHVNDARNAIFKEWADSGGRNLLFGISEEDTGAIGKLLEGVLNILNQVHDAFINAFGSDFLASIMYGVTEVISKIANGFERLTSIPIIYSALGSIFSIIKSIIVVVKELYKIVEPFIEFALSVVEKILQGIGKVAEVIASTVNKISEKINGLAEYLLKPFQDASNFITNIFGKALDFVSEKISSMWNWLKQFDIFGIMGDIENVLPNGSQELSDGMAEAADNIDRASESVESLNKNLEETDDALNQTGSKVSIAVDGFEMINDELENMGNKSREATGTWWDLISEAEKKQFFMAEYWDDLTEAQKEGWKQYALGLGLFTEEELRALESTEKSIDELLDDREHLINKKRAEADAWWNLIEDDKKKQYFAGEYWDELTDEQREAWRKRAEDFKLFDPEEYARVLETMSEAEQKAFDPENTENIVESAEGLETWCSSASKIPVVGGFLETISSVLTKTATKAKSFVGAVKTSFGGFVDYIKKLNGMDYTFSEKFSLAVKYFKENVADYLWKLIDKNFKAIGDAISNTNIVSKLSSFTSAVKERFNNFKEYVSDLNKNSSLTFPEKFKQSIDYFKTNVVDYLGQLVGTELADIASTLSENKIISNFVSLIDALKTKSLDFKSYISDLNANTELTFPEKLRLSLEYFKNNVIDYFFELINKNLKSIGIDIEKIGKDISDAFTKAASFIDETLNKLGINTEVIRKFFWNDDGSLKSIPEVISGLGEEIEKALNDVKARLRAKYEEFFPSDENGELTGPLGWLSDMKKKIDELISSIFGTNKELEKIKGQQQSDGGILGEILGILGLTGGISLMPIIGNMNSIFTFLKNVGIAGSFNFGKIAIGIGLVAGAFTLLSKIDLSKIGIDFKGLTDYFKDGEGKLLSVSEIFTKIGESLSKTKIGEWVVNLAKVIEKNASSAFTLFKDKALYFKEFIKVLNETDLTFPQKFSYAVRFFKEQFVIPFGELVKKNLKTIGIDIDGFLSKFKKSEGDWFSIGDILENVGNRISGVIQQLKTKLENTKVFQWISEKFQEFKAKNPEMVKWFDSIGDSISKVADRIANAAKLLSKNTSTAFTIFGEQIGVFKGHLQNLNENTELTFPEKFKAALEYFKTDFIDPFTELAKSNLKTIGIDIDAFVNFFKNNEGGWLSIGDIIKKVGEKIHNAFGELKVKFEQSAFGKWISGRIEWIKDKLSGISEWLSTFSNNVSRYIVPIISGAGIVLALSRVSQLFDFIQSIGQKLSGRTPIEKANAFATKVEALVSIIRNIAVSVMMIAGTLAGLSLLNQDELAKASDSLSNVIRAITLFIGVVGIMARLNAGTKEKANSAALAILEIAGSILLIVTAFKIITTISLNWGELIQQFVILGVLMAMTVALAKYTSGIEGSKSSFLGMIGIATAVLEMVGALYLVQLMLESHQGIGWALLTLLGLVGTFGLLCKAANGVDWKAGVGLVLMAHSVRTMLDAIEYVLDSDLLDKFGDNWQERIANIVKIILVFASLAGLSWINGLSGGGKAGLNLLGVAASVWVLVQAIEQIAEIPTDKLLPALGVVAALSIIMGGILVWYSAVNNGNATGFKSMIATTVQMYSVVTGVLLLCAAVALLSTIERSSLITAAEVVGGLSIVVGAIAVLMAVYSRKADFGKSLGLLGTTTLVVFAMGGLILALNHYIPDKSNLMSIAGSVSLLSGVVGGLAIAIGLLDLKYAEPGKVAVMLLEMAAVVAAMGTVLTVMVNNFPKDFDIGLLWSIAGTVSVLSAVVAGLSIAFGKIELNNNIDISKVFESLAAMTLVVSGISATLLLVANNLPKDMDIDALWAIVGAAVALSAVSGVLALLFGNIKIDFKAAAKGAGAIALIGLIVEGLVALAAVIYDWKGDAIEKIVSIVERIGKGVSKMFSGIVDTIGRLSWDKLIAVIALVAGSLAAAALAGLPIAGGLAAIIGIVGLVIEGLVALAAVIYDWKGDAIESIVTLMGRAGRGFAEIFDSIMNTIGKLSWQQLLGAVVLFSTVIGEIGILGPSIGFGIGVFAAELAVAAAVVVGIFDLTLPLFEKFADEGIPIFEKIASGIVKIASIIMQGIIANVETIIKCLRDFTNFAVNEFDAEKVGEAVGIAGQLTSVIGAFTGHGFLDALGKFISEKLFGEENRKAFKTNIECLTGVMNDFKTEIANWTIVDLAKTKIATDIAEQLTDVCNAFTIDSFRKAFGAFVEMRTELGENNRKTFIKNITTIGTALAVFCAVIDTIPAIDTEKVNTALTIADKMIELVNKFTGTDVGEAIGKLISGALFDSNKFNTNITNLSSAVTTFCAEVGNWVIPADYDTKFQIVDKLIEFANKMPEVAAASDLMDLSTFGDSVKAFSESFLSATYYLNSALSKAQITDYEGKMALMDDLITLTNKLPRVAGSMQKLINFNIPQTLGDFGTDVKKFGEHLKAFADAMNNVPVINNWETAKTVIGELIDFAKLLPKDSSTFEKEVGYGFQMGFDKFGEEIEAFAISFGKVVESINALSFNDETFTKFGQMSVLIEDLAELAKQLPQSFSQADASGNSNTITSTFTKTFTEFMDDLLGTGNKGKSLFDRVNEAYNELDELGNFDDNGRREKLESLVGRDGILQQLADFTNNLPDFTTNSTTLSAFGLEIYELSNHIADAAETLSSNNSGSDYRFDPKPLEDLGKGVNGIIFAFDGIDDAKLANVSSIMGSISNLVSDKSGGSGLGDLLSNFVNGFLGEPFKKIGDAQANSAGISTILGNISGLGDLINGISPEGGFDMASISQLFGSIGSDGGTSGGILSLIPASLSQFTTDMPESSEITAATEPLTSMFTGLSFDFSSLGPLMGNFTQGSGFDDSGILQTMPKEIQDYVSSMTGAGAPDIESANQLLTDLSSGMKEAGSLTPELSTNFNTTMKAFADNGISAYTDVFSSAETDTKLNNAGKSLIDKTGTGINSALSSTPNKVQTASKAVVKFITDILSGDNSNPYNAPAKPILDKTASGITSALSSASSLKNAVKSVVKLIVEILSGNDETNPYDAPGSSIITKTASSITSALSSEYSLENAVRSVVNQIVKILSGNGETNPYDAPGSSIVTKTANGITSALSNNYSLVNAASSMVNVVTGALYNNYESYKMAGENVISGFVAGMSDTSSVYNAAYEIGQAAVSGLSDGIEAKSPSREAMKYGNYFGEGFEIGISSYGDVVKTASENVGNEAVLGLASYVGRVYDLLDSDLDVNPRITPVLDLSEIQNGVGLVDAMFSKRQAYSTNMEVNGALRARSEAMRTVNSTTDNSRNFGGFTFNIYTQGTDANAIAKQIGEQVTRKLRSTGNLI